MRIITTRKGQEILVDDEDFEKFGHLSWHLSCGYPATGRLDGTNGIDYLSRLVMGIKRGDPARVDYVNNDKLDTRKQNLRIRVGGKMPIEQKTSKKALEAIAQKEAEWAEKAKIPERIFTSKGNEVLYSIEDWPMLCRYLWLEETNGYAYANVPLPEGGRRKIKMHRMVLGIVDEPNVHTDHINRDRLDNRRENLRPCTLAQNTRNIGIPRHNTSGYKGASFHKLTGKWQGQISLGVKGKKGYLGLFDTPEEAHAAYCRAAVEHYGEFASEDDKRIAAASLEAID